MTCFYSKSLALSNRAPSHPAQVASGGRRSLGEEAATRAEHSFSICKGDCQDQHILLTRISGRRGSALPPGKEAHRLVGLKVAANQPIPC